jgi:hypothetical protein
VSESGLVVSRWIGRGERAASSDRRAARSEQREASSAQWGVRGKEWKGITTQGSGSGGQTNKNTPPSGPDDSDSTRVSPSLRLSIHITHLTCIGLNRIGFRRVTMYRSGAARMRWLARTGVHAMNMIIVVSCKLHAARC